MAQLALDLRGVFALDTVFLKLRVSAHQLDDLRQVVAGKTVDLTRFFGGIRHNGGNAAPCGFHAGHRGGKLRVGNLRVEGVQRVQIGGNAVEHRVHVLAAGGVGNLGLNDAGGAKAAARRVGGKAQPR